MSQFQGREIDDIRLWSNYIDIPIGAEKEDHYWSKVVCPNPAHDTHKRHFQVNVQDGLVHCFAECGISGTYVHALCIIHGFYDDFKVQEATDQRDRRKRIRRAEKPAKKIILGFAGSNRRKSSIVKHRSRANANHVSTESLEYETYIPQAGVEYLDSRGISSESVARFALGWDSEELRLVIPGRDLHRKTRFLIRRAVLDRQHPKYLYTEGFPKNRLLFGACECDLGLIRSRGIVLVEGSLDAIRLHQHGINFSTATLGTGISEAQLEIVARLRPCKVFCFFDKDVAGIQGLEIAERRFRGKYPLYVVRYPSSRNDPAEFSREEANRAIDRAIPFRSFKRRAQRKVRSL